MCNFFYQGADCLASSSRLANRYGTDMKWSRRLKPIRSMTRVRRFASVGLGITFSKIHLDCALIRHDRFSCHRSS